MAKYGKAASKTVESAMRRRKKRTRRFEQLAKEAARGVESLEHALSA